MMERPKRVRKPRTPYTPQPDRERNLTGTGPRSAGGTRRRRCRQCGLPTQTLQTAGSAGKAADAARRPDRSGRHRCADCGLAQTLDKFRQRSRARPPAGPSAEERRRFEAEFAQFSSVIQQHLGDADAAHLFCPVIRKRPCGCMQKYILGEDGDSDGPEECIRRASELHELRKKADKLRKLKYLDKVDESTGTLRVSTAQSRRPGLGGGHRKNPAYESLVLQQRLRLKGDLSLCETAAQRILLYSNCFLHRPLSTDPLRQNRIQKTNDRRHKRCMKPISEISGITCCQLGCTKMADTYSKLVTRWREQSAGGQRAARTVLAEMLTPCASGTRNCRTFVHLVTGCSDQTVQSVMAQLEDSHGDRTPPEHGLKSYWVRKKALKESCGAPESAHNASQPEQAPPTPNQPTEPSDSPASTRAAVKVPDHLPDPDKTVPPPSRPPAEPSGTRAAVGAGRQLELGKTMPPPSRPPAEPSGTRAAVGAGRQLELGKTMPPPSRPPAESADSPANTQATLRHQSATIAQLQRRLASQQRVIERQQRRIASLARPPG